MERLSNDSPLNFYSSPARGERSRTWNWWSEAGRGGGIWGAVGSHFVDALRYFGLEPEAVQAALFTLIEQRPLDGLMQQRVLDGARKSSGEGGGWVPV